MVLLTLGLDSTFAWAETFLCYVDDGLKQIGIQLARWKVVGLVCVGFFLCGLPYCTRMGNELLDTVDHYVVSYYLLFGVALEAAMSMYNFGWRRLAIAVKRATLGNTATPNGRKLSPELFWKFCLACAVPVMCLFLLVHQGMDDIQKAYEGYPGWVQAVGWSSLLLTFIMTPVGAMWEWKGKCKLPPMAEEETAFAELVQQHGGRCPSPLSEAISDTGTKPAENASEAAEAEV